MATEKVDILTVNTEPSRTSVKELRKEMKSLKDELLNLEEGTVEYNATLQKAAGIQHTLKEQMEEVNASAMDAGQLLGNATNAVAGMTGAFQAGAGIMNMFGVESEASMEMIAKMQNVMAITQGFQAIDEGMKAFKRLGLAIKATTVFQKLFGDMQLVSAAKTKILELATKGWGKALIATGIGAIVVLIGTLIANLDKLTAAFESSSEKAEKAAKNASKNNIDRMKDELRLMEARGASKEEIYKQEYKIYQAERKDAKEALDAIKDKNSEEYASAKQLLHDLDMDQKEANEKYLKGINDKHADEAKANQKAADDAKKKSDDRINKQIEDDKALVEKAEAELKNKRQSDLQNALDDENEKYKKEKAAYIRQKKDIKELKAQHEKDIKKIEDDAAAEALAKQEADAKELSDKLIEGYEKRKVALTDAEQQELSIMTKKLADKKITQEEFDEWKSTADDLRIQNEITSLNNLLNNTALSAEAKAEIQRQITGLETEQSEKRIEANKTETEKKKEETDKQIALEQEKVDTILAVTGALSGALAGAADLAKEGSREQKNLKIAASIIDTISGGISAYMSAQKLPTPFNFIVGATNAATVLAAGFANIKKMKSINVGGDSGGGPSMPSVSLAGLAASQAPVQATTQVTGASTEASIPDTRVYVVESDITNTQRKVTTAEAEATF